MRSLEGVVVVLRWTIASCLLVLAAGAVLHTNHPGHCSAVAGSGSPRVLAISLVRDSATAGTVQLRLSSPLAADRSASVRVAGRHTSWACHRPDSGLALLTCPVGDLTHPGTEPVRFEVNV